MPCGHHGQNHSLQGLRVGHSRVATSLQRVLSISQEELGTLTVVTVVLSSQPDPWNTHVWKGTNGTPTKRRAIGFKKLAEYVS